MHFLIFDPQGPVAGGERGVMLTVVLVMLAIVVPVLATLYVVAWKYRAGRKGPVLGVASHDDRPSRGKRQILLWVAPAAIVAVLAVVNWQSAHALDPSRPLSSSHEQVTVDVVALDWKWLFIYPAQGIATLNFLEIPENTPVAFRLTADGAPMNSFWIPQLGGQIYAMAGMSTLTHLMADQPGDYRGQAAEINGPGYSDMTFEAKSVSQDDFDAWVASVKRSSAPLTLDAYKALVAPGADAATTSYASVPDGLYDAIVVKYMSPSGTVAGVPAQ